MTLEEDFPTPRHPKRARIDPDAIDYDEEWLSPERAPAYFFVNTCHFSNMTKKVFNQNHNIVGTGGHFPCGTMKRLTAVGLEVKEGTLNGKLKLRLNLGAQPYLEMRIGDGEIVKVDGLVPLPNQDFPNPEPIQKHIEFLELENFAWEIGESLPTARVRISLYGPKLHAIYEDADEEGWSESDGEAWKS